LGCEPLTPPPKAPNPVPAAEDANEPNPAPADDANEPNPPPCEADPNPLDVPKPPPDALKPPAVDALPKPIAVGALPNTEVFPTGAGDPKVMVPVDGVVAAG